MILKSPELPMLAEKESDGDKEDKAELAKKLAALDIKGYIEDEENNQLFSLHSEYVVEALATLVIRLEKHLTDYKTIIGDDVSGRLIALFLSRIIKKQRQAAGLEVPQTLFIAGGRGDHKIRAQKISEFLKTKEKSLGKTLLVTEYISTGEGMAWVTEIMAELKIDFDLATLSLAKDANYVRQKLPEMKGNLYFGEENEDSSGFFFYFKKESAGVDKPFESEDVDRVTAHSTRRKDIGLAADHEKMKNARHSLYNLADRIIDRCLTTSGS